MTLKRALVVLFLVAMATLSGCGGDGGTGSRSPAASEHGTWVVTGATTGGERRALVPGSEIRLRFAGDALQVTAGCNTMSGTYDLDGTRLRVVGGLASTEMGCSPALTRQDAWIATLFARPVQLSLGPDAALISGSAVLSLAPREQVAPDEPLEGTRWVLDTVSTGGPEGVASSVDPASGAFLRIVGDRAQADDGCNGLAGSVSVTATTLTFPGMTMHDVHCGGPQGAVRELLHGTVRFDVEENRLTLTKGGRSLGFHAG